MKKLKKFKLPKLLKAKWLKALRSGKYKQGQGCLFNGEAYCCLGVLADVQGAKWGKINDYGEGGRQAPTIKGKQASQNGKGSFLIPALAGGLPEPIQQHLAEMNDGDGDYYSNDGSRPTFRQIANFISRNL